MNRIFLIGFMAAGKSTLGKRMAEYLHWDFIDLDSYIENKAQLSIPSLFDSQGEEGFRILERRCLHEVAENEPCVISTGGGTPCFSDNLEFMKSVGLTVFLDVPEEELLKRLESDKGERPMLYRHENRQSSRENTLPSRAHHLFVERLPYYQKADFIFHPDQDSLSAFFDGLPLARR